MNRRATTFEELKAVFEKMFSEASYNAGLAFQPQPTDVVITPYAKSGTTWLQHIAHGLRTGGSLAFDEISAVTPWIEAAADLNWDLEAPQVAEPRLFKSHLNYDNVPKGARYIYAIRDSKAVAESYYRFFEGWLFEPGSFTPDEYTRWRWPRDENRPHDYWYHVGSWWEQRHNENVLLLCYEEMTADLPGTVRLVAAFLGINLDDALHTRIVHQSTRDFMLAHKEKFDEKYMRRRAEQLAGIPPNGDSLKVTPGSNGRAHQLSPQMRAELDDMWRERMTPRTGLQSYDDLRRAIRELHQPPRPQRSGQHQIGAQ